MQQRNAGKSVALRALELVARFQHGELADETLVASRLDEDEARELVRLAARRFEGGEPLSGEELGRYEWLVGKTADDERLFARKRVERAEADKLGALAASAPPSPRGVEHPRRRHGRRGAVDALRHRLREGAVEVTSTAASTTGCVPPACSNPNTSAPSSSSSPRSSPTAANRLTCRSGVPGGGLPPVPRQSLPALRRAGYITATEVGSGIRIGLGPRAHEIAAQWGIALPDADS